MEEIIECQSSKIEVSVIIVNYNTSKLLFDCINSIYKYTNDITIEVIVVDNNSNELNISLLKDISLPFKLILLKDNLGFGKANNKGLEIAKGDYIMFLNPDTLLKNNAIKILKHFMDSHSNCGACGGNLYDEYLNPTHSYNLRFPGLFDELDQALKRVLSKFIDKGNTMFNRTCNPRKVAFITGADLMVRHNLLNKIGGFNPLFFMYFEDTELQYRINKIGLENWSVPDAKIIHLEGKSFKISRDRERRILVSRRLYYEITKGIFFRNIMDSYYYFLNTIAYGIALIFNIKNMKEKLSQRISILKELK